MGWAYYEVDGRECGYSVAAVCDEDGCTAEIDRGLAYLCGDLPGQEDDQCGLYFCGSHLYYASNGQRCERCSVWDDEETE